SRNVTEAKLSRNVAILFSRPLLPRRLDLLVQSVLRASGGLACLYLECQPVASDHVGLHLPQKPDERVVIPRQLPRPAPQHFEIVFALLIRRQVRTSPISDETRVLGCGIPSHASRLDGSCGPKCFFSDGS